MFLNAQTESEKLEQQIEKQPRPVTRFQNNVSGERETKRENCIKYTFKVQNVELMSAFVTIHIIIVLRDGIRPINSLHRMDMFSLLLFRSMFSRSGPFIH